MEANNTHFIAHNARPELRIRQRYVRCCLRATSPTTPRGPAPRSPQPPRPHRMLQPAAHTHTAHTCACARLAGSQIFSISAACCTCTRAPQKLTELAPGVRPNERLGSCLRRTLGINLNDHCAELPRRPLASNPTKASAFGPTRHLLKPNAPRQLTPPASGFRPNGHI